MSACFVNETKNTTLLPPKSVSKTNREKAKQAEKVAVSDLVDAFRVAGIPHMTLITATGDVRTALVGNVPRDVVVADLDALVSNTELPYIRYDAFAGGAHNVAVLSQQ
jgi:thioredoxin-related protein